MKTPFRSYDIRGKYPEQLDEKIAYKIGRAFVVYSKSKQIVVGRDARKSSTALKDALVKGIIDQGADVTDIGLCTTPMNYFANGFYKFDASAMVTASHLEKEYNGFKLCKKNVIPLGYETGGKEIELLVERGNFKDPKSKGKYKKKDILKDYKRFMLKGVEKTKLKVIVDAANMMGAIDGNILKSVCKVKPLDFKTDGNFPTHGVNPLLKKNISHLEREVYKSDADLGIAFDGDSDRVIFVDEHGRAIPADLLLAFLAENTLKKGQTVVASVQCSMAVEQKVKAKGGKFALSKTGGVNIKELMRKKKAVLGGEKSGHYYYKEFWNADSPLLTSLKVLQILSKSKATMSQLMKPYREYISSGETNYEVQDKKKAMRTVERLFSPHAKKVLKLDGLSIYSKNFWFNIRESKTEDLLRLNLESKSKAKIKEVLEIFNDILKHHQ